MSVPTRADIQRSLPNASPTFVQFIERLAQAVDTNTVAIGTGVAATEALQDATVVTLSPNDTLTSERVIEAGQGIRLTDTGTALVVATLANIVENGGYQLTLNLVASAILNVIDSGTVMVSEIPLIQSGTYSGNAAAVAAGLPLGTLYHISGGDTVGVVHS